MNNSNNGKAIVTVHHGGQTTKSFSLNATFSLSITDLKPYTVKVVDNSMLKVQIVTSASNELSILTFSSQDNPEALTLCSLNAYESTFGLGLEIIGPRIVTFHAKYPFGGEDPSINLFGSCASFRFNNDLSLSDTTLTSSLKRKLEDPESATYNSSTPNADKLEEKVNEEDVGIANSSTSKSSNKKVRKKLAKQKQMELEAVLNEKRQKNGEEKDKEAIEEIKYFTTKDSLSERRLSGGVKVKDIIIGGGPLVKTGRRIELLYEGKLADGTVFDKKQNRKSPLRFRHGTGQVIKGLERGLEGMRAGGERTIVIPPNMGYGAKGAGGTIPKNATLSFNVYLLSVGSSS